MFSANLPTTLAGRFWRFVEVTPTCWVWTSKIARNGYGVLTFKRKSLLAHRVSHEVFIGQIPQGLEIHHQCNNKRCVNPHHIKAVRHHEHIPNALKTHCLRGHEFSESNTYISMRGEFKKRACMACLRIRSTIRKKRT